MNEANQGFEAFASHTDQGDEMAGGMIFLDRWRLRFQSDSVNAEIPIERLEIEWDEKGGQVSFNDPTQPGLKIFTLDESVLRHPAFALSPRIHNQVQAQASRSEMTRRLRITLYFFAACALIACLVSLASGAMVRSLAASVPSEWENTFGDEQVQELRDKMDFVDDSNQVARLTALAAPLIKAVPAGKTQFKFHIVESGFPNAFALPGGHILITTALLQLADRPEELLGVIAHEMAHITQKHHARKIISAAGPLVIFGIFFHSRDQTMEVLSGGSGLLVTQGFSQEYELEADDFGWKYLVMANIDPHGMIDMFQKMKTSDSKLKMASVLPQAFSSHPALDKRLARLEKRWKKLPDKTGFMQLEPVDWKQP